MIYPNIRTEMERSGLTVNQLAARLGLPLNTFAYKLHGKHEFTLHEIECLADLFDCSLDYLVGHMGNGRQSARGAEHESRGAEHDPMDCEFFFSLMRGIRCEKMFTMNPFLVSGGGNDL